MSSQYTYYIEPNDDDANEMIAQFFNAGGMSSETLEQRAFVTAEGRKVIGAYRISDHAFITRLKKSKHKNRFRVYVQEGEGQIRSYNLYYNSSRRLSKLESMVVVARKGK